MIHTMEVEDDPVDGRRVMSPTATKKQGFWTDRKVAWYERANARSDYAARVFGAVQALLDDCRTALDVGAGFGALALPLARRLERVTALEPAPAMVQALRRAAARNGADNLTILEAAWGEVEVGPHDLLLCAHVGPLLGRGSAFLAAITAHARRGVVLVRDVPGGEDKFFFRELYPVLLGREYERCCDYQETVGELEAAGVSLEMTPIEYASDQPFDSLEEACDFWMEYMELSGAEARAYLRDALARRLRRHGEEWIAPFRKRAMVIHWRTSPARGRP